MGHYCKNCGTPLKENGKFCHVCGIKIEMDIAPEVEIEEHVFCENCGSEMGLKEDFCGECGHSIHGALAKPKKSNGRNKSIVVGLVAVVAIIILAVALMRVRFLV